MNLDVDIAIELSYLEALTEAQLERQREIVRARRYHDGDHDTFLTARLREFLSVADNDTAFRMNLCRPVVDAVIERLLLARIESGDAALQDWADALATANRLDLRSTDVHEMAVRDGESFLMVDWDDENERARFTPHPAYTSTDANGDGFGFQMAYPDDDVSLPPLYAVKRWVEEVDNQLTQRATFYYPDRIQKLVYGSGGWQPISDADGEPWPIPWTNQGGDPLGIAVVHFQNKHLRPEAADALPLQDLLNKTVIDLAASADVTAFRIFVALGFMPTSDGKALAADGSNKLGLAPGQIVGTTAKATEASFVAIDGADLSQLRELKKDWVLDIASVTNTPAGRFQTTREVAAEGTLKQQEEPLMAKVRNRQGLFGAGWESVFNLARAIENHFGNVSLSEEAAFVAKWQDSQTRTDEQRQAEWRVKKDLGIPRSQLWSEMGYTPEQIETMLKDPEVQNSTFAGYP